MKFRPLWLAVPAIALLSGSCGKKETATTETPAASPAETPKVAETPVTPVTPPAPAIPALSAEQRAAKFGIVGHLPKETDSLLAVYGGTNLSKRFKGTKAWELIEETSGMQGLDEEKKPEGEADSSGPGALLGQEVFLATGKGTSAQTGNLLTVNRRSSYFQMKLITRAFLAAVKSKGMEEVSSGISEAQMKSFIEVVKDPESGVGLLDKMQMPPVYVGFKTLEADRERVAQQVASVVEFLSSAEEMVEPVEFERAGAKFTGYRLLGEKVSKSLAEGRESMDEQLGAETVDHLIASLAKKNLIAVSGTLGDYVILFLGSTPEDCQLVADAKDSLASTEALAFADGYASKEIASLVYGSDQMMETIHTTVGGLADITSGIRDGLAGEEGLGDTRDIESLLQLVGEREQALTKLSSVDTYGLVAFMEQGLKIETFGGTDTGAIDWKAPSTLASLGKPDDVVLFANFSSDATYDAKAKAYAESLVETAYAVAKKVAEAPIESDEIKQFKEGMSLFDTKFRADTLTLLDSLRGDLASGIGNESALVVDLKGAVPAIPGIPQVLVDKGRFLRASWISPVKDRSKLSTSWDKMNESTTKILKSVSELAGKDIPMQKPMSSEKNGYTTWFFSMPFFNDDFVPSITVGDKWFVASTSKLQALELTAAAGNESSDRTGFYMNVKLDPLRSFGNDWLKLVDENSATVFADEADALEQFKDNKKEIEKALVALGDFESITAHVRREAGHIHGSIHFKTH